MPPRVSAIEVRTGSVGPRGADGAAGADGADGQDGADGTFSTFIELGDVPASYSGFDGIGNSFGANLGVNAAGDGLEFHYSTDHYVDLRDYGTLADGGDITTAMQAAVNAFDTHHQVRIRVPKTGTSSGSYFFDPASINWNDAGFSGVEPWIIEFDTGQIIKLTSTWTLSPAQTIRGLKSSSLGIQVSSPVPRPRLQGQTGVDPVLLVTNPNCLIEHITVDGNDGGAIKTANTSLVTMRDLTVSTAKTGAYCIQVDNTFWVEMRDIWASPKSGDITSYCFAFTTNTAASTVDTGIVRCYNLRCNGNGMYFRCETGSIGVDNIEFIDTISEDFLAGASLFTFDGSSGSGAITQIKIVRAENADAVGANYVIHNIGTRTSNIHYEGVPHPTLLSPTATAIKSLTTNYIHEHPTSSKQQLSSYFAGEDFGIYYRMETPTSIDAKLLTAPLAPQTVIGSPLTGTAGQIVTQDPASWTAASGSTVITTGILAPDGSTMAARVATDHARCFNSAVTVALGDWFIAGVWIDRTSAAGSINGVNCIFSSETAGTTLNDGANSGKLAGMLEDKIPDNGWRWVSCAYKVTSIAGGTTPTLRFTMASGGEYFAPSVMKIPASAGYDEAFILNVARRLATGWSMKATKGGVALLDHQPLFALGGVVRSVGPVVNATTAYTLAYADACKVIEMNNSSASVVTIPPTTAVSIPVGVYYDLIRTGAGAVSITTGSSVTLLSLSSARIINGQYAMARVYKSTGDTWVATGTLSTV